MTRRTTLLSLLAIVLLLTTSFGTFARPLLARQRFTISSTFSDTPNTI